MAVRGAIARVRPTERLILLRLVVVNRVHFANLKLFRVDDHLRATERHGDINVVKERVLAVRMPAVFFYALKPAARGFKKLLRSRYFRESLFGCFLGFGSHSFLLHRNAPCAVF